MKRSRAAVLMLCMLLASAVRAQDWNITGAGARAEGFSGAFIGIADDATAIVWNPAGLGQLERTEVSAVGRYITETSELKNVQPGFEYTQSNTQSHFNFNFASLAVPFSAGSSNIVLAVAYQTQLDFYQKSVNIERDTTESTGAASTITPGIAIRFGSVFSLGLAANVWMGSFDYSTKYASGDRWKSKPEFSGLNFGVGALMDFGGLSTPFPLKLGVAIKTPFTLEADVGYSLNGSSGTYAVEVEMPLMLGFGASLQIGQKFTLAADYEMRQYEGKDLTRTESGSTTSSPVSASDEDLNQFRVGGEYLIVMKGGVIPLRAGYRTVPTVFANQAWDADSARYFPTGQVLGNGFSVGTGFISTSFALDFAFSRERYDEQKWTYEGETWYKANYHSDRYSLSLIIYF